MLIHRPSACTGYYHRCDINGAVFPDFDHVWSNGMDTDDIIITVGYELKYGWKIDDFPLFFISADFTKPLDRWQGNKEPFFYARSSLINPF